MTQLNKGETPEEHAEVAQKKVHAELIDRLPDAVVETDSDSHIHSWNRAAERIYGWSAAEVLGRQVDEVFQTAFPGTSREAAFEDLLSKGSLILDVIHHDKSRRPLNIQASISVTRDGAGRVSGFVSVLRDMTEWKRTEAALQDREHQLRLLHGRLTAALNASPVVAFSQDKDLRYIWIQNPALGYSAEEVAGKTDYDLFERREDAARLEAIKQRVLVTGNGERHEVPIFYHGECRWYDLNIQPQKECGQIVLLCTAVDITKRKHIERALSESEHRLRLAMEASSTGMWDWDLGSNRGVWSAECYEIFGAAHGEFDGTPAAFDRFLHPEDRERVWGALRQAMERRTKYECEFRIVRPDGTVRWVCNVGRAIYDANGGPARMVGTVTDITDRRNAEQALREEEEFTRRVTDIAPSILYVYDLEQRRNVWGNRQMTETLGYTRQEVDALAGNLLTSLLHPDDLQRYPAHHERLLALADGESAEFEYRMRHADGSWRWLYSREMVFRRDGQRRPRQILGSALDVTDRKRVQEALRASEERYRTLFSSISEAFTLKQAVLNEAGEIVDFRFLEANPAFEVQSGLKDVTDKTMREVMPTIEERWIERFAEVVRTGQPVRFQDRASGLGRWFEVFASRVGGDGSQRVAVLFSDVTERRRTNQALRKSEERLRLLTDRAPVLLGHWDPEHRFKFANATYTSRFGLSPEQVIGKHLREVVGEQAYETIHPWLDKGLRGEVADYELQLSYFGRSPQWMRVTYTRELGPGGEVLGIIGAMQDVTERKRSEQALQLRQAELKEAQRLAHVGSWTWDARTDEGTASDEMLRIYGFDPATQAIPKFSEQCGLWYPAEEWKRLSALAQNAIRTGESYETEIQALRNGERIWITARAEAIHDSAGEIIGLRGTVQDITERKLAENALRESERRLTLAQEAGGVGVYDWDVVTGQIVWTPELEKLYGIAASTTNDKNSLWLEHVHPDDRQRLIDGTREWLQSAASEQHREYRFIRPDGQQRWLSGHSLAIRDSDGRPLRVIGTNTDITEQKNFEAELERLVAERTSSLHELVGELEHLSYTITHDMRAPLRAMRGFAEALKEVCGDKGQPEIDIFLRRIMQGAERMDMLITDALQYTNAVRQEIPLAPVDLGALLRGMLETYPQFIGAGIELKQPVLPVLGNEAALTQCFSNLLGNAVKFVKPGHKPQVHVWTERRSETAGGGEGAGWVRIWVEDDGIGVSERMRSKLFQMFSRGSRDYEGTGIGLALVRKVVQRMGGRVGVESEEGKGSRFWVELRPGDVRNLGR